MAEEGCHAHQLAQLHRQNLGKKEGIAVVDWPSVDFNIYTILVKNGNTLTQNRKYIWSLLLGISKDSLDSTYGPFYADL
jgi:hypothetical protein